ncbi:conjugal transfer protein TraK [Seonamhaeicola sp. NFXS20]|uniref:conjugal transfer protein TraK n=1 Tax=Seonamhaeicola sp. NFXS20 TaxID=2816959 RepID=UPI003B8C279F
MKIPYKNIFEVLRINRFIVLTTVGCATLTCLFSVLMTIKMYRESQNNAFVVGTEGDVVPLKIVNQRENFEVEALSHLERFHHYFYNLDGNNYKKQIEKALWLSNSSVSNLYSQKQAEGVYNRLLQYSLVQHVIKIESHVETESEPYPFKTVIIFQINRGTTTDSYELISSGNLIQVERNFPHNPHGLLITDYFENTLRKLEDYENSEE